MLSNSGFSEDSDVTLAFLLCLHLPFQDPVCLGVSIQLVNRGGCGHSSIQP